MEEKDIIFKVGTKVKLRDYLKVGNYYGGMKFEDFCKQDFGKVLKITKVTPCNGYISTTKYEFEETPLEYTVEMLEPIKEKTMKYKVGDKVRIRKDLISGAVYGNQRVVPPMKKYLGKKTNIEGIHNEGKDNLYYTLYIDKENGRWCWSEEMLEPAVEYDLKVGDKVIFNPAEKDKLTGVFTVSEIDMDLGIPYIKLKEVKECMWFDPNRFLKVPIFNVGQIVTFKNIEGDKYFYDTSTMRSINGQPGIIVKIKENQYTIDKPGQDGCKYEVKQFRTGCSWFITSASIKLTPIVTTLDDIKVTAGDDPGPRGDLGVITTTAEAIAQAVDNVKGPQFKIGDKVVIRDDLISGKEYNEWDYSPEDGLGGWLFLSEMAKYKGKVATVTGFGDGEDVNYLRLDIDEGKYSWIINAVSHYTPGSDYDLDRTVININQQKKQNKQNDSNQLQGKEEPLIGGCECTGTGVCYPGEQAATGIRHLGYRKVTYKC